MSNYSNKQLEEIAIGDLKKMLFATTNKKVQVYISSNDKEPIWDGHIYIYNKEASESNSDFKTRLPVQIKATNVSKFSTKFHSYNISSSCLNAYYNEGGVIYFVVEVKDNKNGLPETKIFYRVETSVDIKKILNSLHKTQKQKAIHIDRILTVEDNFLMQCDYLDKARKLVSIDSVNNMIPIEKVSNKPITLLTANGEEDILKGEYVAYYTNSYNMKLPVSIDNRLISISHPENRIIPIDDKRSFNNCMRTKDSNGDEYITFGDTIKYYITKKKVTIEPSTSNIIDRYNTLDFFLNNLLSPNSKLNNEDQKKINLIKDEKEFLAKVIKVCDVFKFDANTINLKDFKDFDFEAIDILSSVNAFNTFEERKEKLKSIEPTIINFSTYKIALLNFIFENESIYYNYYDKNFNFQIGYKLNDRKVVFNRFITIDTKLINCYNFDYDLVFNTFNPIEKENADIISTYYNNVLLNFIKAWDINPKNCYMQIIKQLDKYLNNHIEKDIQLLNEAQVEYRLNNKLDQKTKDNLYKIKFNPKTTQNIQCGISILLEDYQGFEDIFNKLSPEIQEQFKSFPIYNLYKNHNKM